MGTAQSFCRSGLKSGQGCIGQYIVLSGSATNPEDRRKGEREDRKDGWMDGGEEEWRAEGLLCCSSNGHSENVHVEKRTL